MRFPIQSAGPWHLRGYHGGAAGGSGESIGLGSIGQRFRTKNIDRMSSASFTLSNIDGTSTATITPTILHQNPTPPGAAGPDKTDRQRGFVLKRFPAKACPGLDPGWRPVRVKKTRQIKNLEPRFDSIETEKALEFMLQKLLELRIFCYTLRVDSPGDRPC